MQLLAIVVADGISLKGPGGNVAPGCAPRWAPVSPSVALEALDAVEVWATPETDFEAIASTIEIVAHDYPRVTLLL